MTKLDFIRAQKPQLIQLAKNYGVLQIRIFGSVARHEETASSDIDLLIELAPGRSAFDMGGFLVDAEELLHCKVDLVTENGLDPLIKDVVLKEAVAL